jgi:hypothetical protein
MSTPELPEDLARWPDDPYALLGVRPGILPRELRRVYAQLIRVYKPEQYPEHFRRIRAAYELVLQHAEFFSRMHTAEEESDPVEGAAPAEVVEQIPTMPRPVVPENDVDAPTWPDFDPRDVPLARTPGPVEEVRDLWQHAVAGDAATAYRRLVELHDRQPHAVAPYAPLYWLLTLHPEFDPARVRCDWLVAGLRNSGLTGPLWELYHRELAADPSEALSARCSSLLDCAVRPGLLADVLEWRWWAAGPASRWQVIAADLDRLRDRIVRDDEEAWIRLLLAALDHLVWDEGPAVDLVARFRREIDRHGHLQIRLADSLDRLEFLLEVAAGWRSLQRARLPWPEFLQLIPLSWVGRFDAVRPLLMEVVRQATKRPRQTLDAFDRVQRQAPAVLAHFGSQLDLLQASVAPAERRLETFAETLTVEFLDGNDCSRYAKFRLQLLDFCLREEVTPEEVAAIAGRRPAYWVAPGTPLAQAINADWPLRHVYRAHWLFWAESMMG